MHLIFRHSGDSGKYCVTSVCRDFGLRVHCRIFNCTVLTMAICVQDLDSAVLYAFLLL